MAAAGIEGQKAADFEQQQAGGLKGSLKKAKEQAKEATKAAKEKLTHDKNEARLAKKAEKKAEKNRLQEAKKKTPKADKTVPKWWTKAIKSTKLTRAVKGVERSYICGLVDGEKKYHLICELTKKQCKDDLNNYFIISLTNLYNTFLKS